MAKLSCEVPSVSDVWSSQPVNMTLFSGTIENETIRNKNPKGDTMIENAHAKQILCKQYTVKKF